MVNIIIADDCYTSYSIHLLYFLEQFKNDRKHQAATAATIAGPKSTSLVAYSNWTRQLHNTNIGQDPKRSRSADLRKVRSSRGLQLMVMCQLVIIALSVLDLCDSADVYSSVSTSKGVLTKES